MFFTASEEAVNRASELLFTTSIINSVTRIMTGEDFNIQSNLNLRTLKMKVVAMLVSANKLSGYIRFG